MKRRRFIFESLEGRHVLSAVVEQAASEVGSLDGFAEMVLRAQQEAGERAMGDPIAAKLGSRLSEFSEVVRLAFDTSLHAEDGPSNDEVARDLNSSHVGTASVDNDGRIQVHIYFGGEAAPVISSIANVGGKVESIRSQARVMQAWVPWDGLRSIAAEVSVERIDLPSYATLNTGSVNTAGDGILRADDVRSLFADYGINGSGVRVGVISGGVAHRSNVQSEADPNLPATITLHPVLSGWSTNDEGTAMLEIVHDLAPSAALFFAGFHPNGDFTTLDMADAVDWLVQQGVHVIVDDIEFRHEPYFYEGPAAVVASAVQDAVNAGVAYVTAAGNAALRHYQGQWNGAADGFHDFDLGAGTDTFFAISVPGNATVEVNLQWSDAWGASGNNYDLILRHPITGNNLNNLDPGETNEGVVVQNGDDTPAENVDWRNPQSFAQTIDVRVTRVGTPANRELEIFISPNSSVVDNHLGVIGDSIHGHQALAEVISVGGINASDPGNDNIRPTSARGPSTIYTDFGNQTRELRNSLDGAAITEVQTRVGQLGFFSNPFGGTSAAAPHVAGIAALLLSNNAALTPAQVAAALGETAVDIEAAAYDHDSGAGRFDAFSAVYSVFSPPANVISVTPAPGSMTNVPNPPLSIDAEFSKPVIGVDISDLVVSGAGASVTAVTSIPATAEGVKNTYRFVVNAPSDGMINFVLGPDLGDITDVLGSNVAPFSWTYTIDRTVARPVRPNLDAASDTGHTNTDNITSVQTPMFVGGIGSVPANATVRLYDGTTELGSATATGQGSWSIPTGTLSSGAHPMHVTVNGGPNSPALVVTIDTTAPAQPLAPDLDTGSDTGTSSSDDVTSDTTPTFVGGAGSAEPASAVGLLEGTSILGVARANADGSWSITTNTLSATTHVVYVRTSDVAGNPSTSATLPVTISTATVTPTAPDLNAASDSGVSNTDNITSATIVTFGGVAGSVPNNTTVDLFEGTTPRGSTVSTATGSWSINTGLPPGAHTLHIRTGGSETSSSMNVVVDTSIAQPAPPDLEAESDTGTSNSDNETNDRTPTFFGIAGPVESNARVQLFEGTTLLGVTTAATDGSWSITTGTLTLASHVLYVKAIDAAGNLSASSTTLPISISEDPDINGDGSVNRTDVAILAANFGRTTGATHAQGDVTGDARVTVSDLMLVQAHLNGGEGLMGGGGGGGESMMGGGEGEVEKPEDTVGETGGGESLLDSTPARFYFTTSASISGGGALGSSVPAITLPEPGQTVDLYIWVQMGTYRAIRGYAIDVSATTAGVVKAVESEIYRPWILDTQTQEEIELRWTLERASVLNPNGVDGTELVYDAAAANILSGLDLRDSYDGTGSRLDPLYDSANDAFLTQRVRLEALPGSAGQSTDLIMKIGRMLMLIDNSTIFLPLPIHFGLGTEDVLNTERFGTDGTIHATIEVATGSPGAVYSSVASPRDARTVAMRTHVERTIRTNDQIRPAVEPQTELTRSITSLRAVRRPVDSRSADRLLTLSIH